MVKQKPGNSFWKATNQEYSADSLAAGNLIKMDELIYRRDALRKPVKPVVDDEDFVMTNTINVEASGRQAERVLL